MIKVWDRKNKSFFEEKVFGGELIDFAYNNPIGLVLMEHILSKPFVSKPLSRLYGYLKSQKKSTLGIQDFCQKYQINLNDFEQKDYLSFNDFFIRKFKPGQRSFSNQSNTFCAPAEGRYFAFNNVQEAGKFPIKGLKLNPLDLVPGYVQMEEFLNGPGYIARLCPVDYHRFHFPDDGQIIFNKTISGKLHSVNALAIKAKPDLLIKNERQVQILETKNFGKIAMIEIGAIAVGKIVQSHPQNQSFKRGQEKGYFLFGGSTVVVLGQKGKLLPDVDMIEKTQSGIETFICLGEKIGVRI